MMLYCFILDETVPGRVFWGAVTDFVNVIFVFKILQIEFKQVKHRNRNLMVVSVMLASRYLNITVKLGNLFM